MATYMELIPQNTAPEGAVAVGLYGPTGKRLTGMALGGLARPELGEKKYSFGALADVHISQDTAEEDFKRALAYFSENTDFVCIAGDLTQYNEDAEWEQYAACAAESTVPIYPVGGNHDAYGSGLTDARFQKYTGYGTFYTFEKENDVFIMLSQAAWASKSANIQPFYQSGLQALYEALEANRNKRCFVFQHLFPWGGAGDPLELYTSNHLFGTQGTVLYSLMAHYPNAVWFHGHSHHLFDGQRLHPKANYDFDRGCHSVHIPSCALPVAFTSDGNRTALPEGSQGYVVEVYENHIILLGRDFVAGADIPLATYCLDTTLKTVEAGTYIDDTGTINI
jgi:3',5'-cyclic AMP phosphodiesterase CpdA